MAICFNLYVYYLIYSGLAPIFRAAHDDTAKGMLRMIERLKYYPLILIVCWIFATINRIYDSVHPNNPILALILLQTIFQSLQGILNALVYGLTPSVRNVWIESFANSGVPFLESVAARLSTSGEVQVQEMPAKNDAV